MAMASNAMATAELMTAERKLSQRRRVRFTGIFASAVVAAVFFAGLNFVGERIAYHHVRRSASVEDYFVLHTILSTTDDGPSEEQRPHPSTNEWAQQALSRQKAIQLNEHQSWDGIKVRKQCNGLACAWPIKNMTGAMCEHDEQNALRIPTFIVPGSQKAGTSAIYELLNMHPHVVSSQKFEAHFFDYELHRLRHKKPDSIHDEDICELRRDYQEYFNIQEIQEKMDSGAVNKIATFEKTPRYLCYTHIPAFVKRIAPWTKILIILRNPVERAYSHWKMYASRRRKDPTYPSFDTVVSENIERMRELGLSKAPTLEQFRNNDYLDEDFQLPQSQSLMRRKLDVSDFNFTPREKRILLLEHLPRGFYAQHIVFWLDYFKYGKEMKIVQYEKLQEDRPGVFRDILNFIDVDPDAWEVDEDVFKVDYRPVKVKGKKAKQGLDNTTRVYLENFYKPYNDELADLLGEEWRGVWDSS